MQILITIEFWLYPAIAENGEQIFNWRSSRNMDRQSMYQVIRACFFNNHIEWNFHNIFSNGRILKDEVILTSLSTIIPQQWSHHSLSRDLKRRHRFLRLGFCPKTLKTQAHIIIRTNGKKSITFFCANRWILQYYKIFQLFPTVHIQTKTGFQYPVLRKPDR